MDSSVSSSFGRRKCGPQWLQSPARATLPPWNTARCNRLLRPLSSKIASFRKNPQYEIQRERESEGPERLPQTKRKQTKTYNAPGPDALSSENLVFQSSRTAKADDQESVASPVPRKRIKRTYSSRDSGHITRAAKMRSNACEPSLLHRVIIQVPDTQDPSMDRQRQTFLRIMGSTPTDGEEISGSGVRAPCPGSSYNPLGPLRESFSQHARRVEPEHWKLINGLYNGLDALLRATEKSKVGTERGTRSLFSTCLRMVPEFIAKEQLQSIAEDPESSVDVASLTYGELEALGTSPTAGWKPLREVVRAHGVSMLGDAIQEGVINASIARGLITICLHYHAYDEAQHLVECIISSMKPLRKLQSIKRLFTREYSDELSTLKCFVTASGRFHVLYQQLAISLSRGTLPIEIISSPSMIDCWNGVIWSITQDDEHARAAIELLQTIIQMTYARLYTAYDAPIHELRMLAHGAPGASIRKTTSMIKFTSLESRPGDSLQADKIIKAASTVISNVLTVLCAVGILGRSTSRDSAPPKTSHLAVMQDLALATHQAIAIAGYDADSAQNIKSCAEFIGLLLLAAKLAKGEVRSVDETFAQHRSVPVDVIAQLGCDETLLSSAASFLCAVARCCERATSVGSFEHLQSIIQQLQDILTSENSTLETRIFCKKIAVAAAFEYSEETNHPKHLHWALDLEQTVTGTGLESIYRTPGKTPARKPHTSKSAYRWEEGICEWVAKTPASLWSKPGFVNDSSTLSSDSESDVDCTASSTSLSQQGLLDLLEASPWSTKHPLNTDHGTRKRHCHLMNGIDCAFQKRIGNTSHVKATVESGDELPTIYRDSLALNSGSEDTEDELSTPSSSQGMPRPYRPKLRELTNIGARMEGERAARWKPSGAETRKRRALCPRAGSKPLRPIDDSFEESEDELSRFTC